MADYSDNAFIGKIGSLALIEGSMDEADDTFN
jgi:hypothetical protein